MIFLIVIFLEVCDTKKQPQLAVYTKSDNKFKTRLNINRGKCRLYKKKMGLIVRFRGLRYILLFYLIHGHSKLYH